MNESKPLDPIGYLLLLTLFFCLSYAGFLAYKSIDWGVLKRLESQTVSVPVSLNPPASASASPKPTAP